MGRCDICLERYQQDELEKHRETCMPRLMIRCTVCNRDYLNKEGLWNHLVEHEIPHGCKEMCYENIRVTYNLHKCLLCNDQRAYQENVFWNHVHDDHDGFFLRCFECGENFRSEKLMTDHVLNDCETRKLSNSGGLDSEVVKLELPEIQQSTVPEMNRESSYLDGVQPRCYLCNANYYMLSVHPDPQHQCPQCSQIFRQDDTLQRILNQHAEEQCQVESKALYVLKCPHCSKQFFRQQSVINHVDMFHTSVTCDICGTSISGTNKLYYHKLTCRAEPKYRCQDCPQKFHLLAAYENHLLEHQDEGKFSCYSCHQTFKNSLCLDLHKQQNCCIPQFKLSETKCFYCDKQCYHAKYFARHIVNVHKPMKCDICEDTFTGKNQLRNHMRIHVKPKHECPICSEKFSKNYVYQRHLLAHRRSEMSTCKYCGLKCRSLANLKQHIKRRHTVNQEVMLPKRDYNRLSEDDCETSSSSSEISDSGTETETETEHHKEKWQSEPNDSSGKSQTSDLRLEEPQALQSHVENDPNITQTSPIAVPTEQTNQKFQCPLCPRTLDTKLNYVSHLQFHKKSQIFSCKFCTVKCNRLGDLKAHIQMRHSGKINKCTDIIPVKLDDVDSIDQEQNQES